MSRRDGFWLLASVTLLVGATWATTNYGVGVAAALLGLVALVCAVLTFGAYRVGAAVLGVGFALSTLISVRLTDKITVGDAALAAGVLLLLLGAPHARSSRTWSLFAMLVSLVALGGTVATLASSAQAPGGLANLAIYVAAAAMALLIARFAGAEGWELRYLSTMFAGGATLSAVNALVTDAPQLGQGGFRAVGLALHPNHLGLTTMLGVAAWLATWPMARTWRGRLVALVGTGICVSALIASGSRAALVGAIVIALLTLVALRRIRIVVFSLLAAVFVSAAAWAGIVTVGEDSAIARLLGGGSAELADIGREERYASALDRIGTAPILGHGFEGILYGHSLYLQMWVGAGVLGLVGAALLIVASTGAYIEATRARRTTTALLWSGYLGYVAAAAFSNQMWDRYLWMYLALCLVSTAGDGALALTETRQSKVERRGGSRPEVLASGRGERSLTYHETGLATPADRAVPPSNLGEVSARRRRPLDTSSQTRMDRERRGGRTP